MLILSAVLLSAQAAGTTAQTEDARREQVMQWGLKADAASCQHLEGALTDSSADIRIRAATALYGKCDKKRTGSRAATQLCRSVELGNASAATFLLLGYAPKAEAEPCLRKTRPAWEKVKLVTASRPVSSALAIRVALARIGDGAALAELRNAFAKNAVDDALFLLAVLRDVQDKAVLEGAMGLLDDTRVCQGVRSESTRLVRDVAADALIDRLALAPWAPLSAFGKRYQASEIAKIREAARSALATYTIR